MNTVELHSLDEKCYPGAIPDRKRRALVLAPGVTSIWRILIVCPGRVIYQLVTSKHTGYIQRDNLLTVNL